MEGLKGLCGIISIVGWKMFVNAVTLEFFDLENWFTVSRKLFKNFKIYPKFDFKNMLGLEMFPEVTASTIILHIKGRRWKTFM